MVRNCRKEEEGRRKSEMRRRRSQWVYKAGSRAVPLRRSRALPEVRCLRVRAGGRKGERGGGGGDAQTHGSQVSVGIKGRPQSRSA